MNQNMTFRFNLFHDEKYKSIVDLFDYLKKYEATHGTNYIDIKIDPELSSHIDVVEIYNEHLINKPF